MDRLAQLEAKTCQLSAAVKSLAHSSRRPSSDAEKELDKARAGILASLADIRTLVAGPADLLQHLASQVQTLACLQWLAEFQILACIPPGASVPVSDLADLAGVPEDQLLRVIRLTAAAGFLHEPAPRLVAHTPLSAQFLAHESLVDAALFLAHVAAPSALQMPSATLHFGAPSDSGSPYTRPPFDPAALHGRPRLGRQWAAYLLHAAGLFPDEEIAHVLSQLNWSGLSHACIVEVGAQSTSMARCLVNSLPGLRVVVQLDPTSTPSTHGGSPRITVVHRDMGQPQPVTDADVYLLHLRAPAGPRGTPTVRSQLHEYLAVLRASGGLLLVLTARLLPEPGSVPNPELEAVVRTRDLTLLQLADEADMEMSDLHSTIDTVSDRAGKLVIASRLRSRNGLVLALAVKYQAH